MTAKQSKRARREAARRAKQRRQRTIWASALLAVVVGVGAVVVRGGSPDEEAALAPDFELASSDGEAVKLSDYRGQPVAVTFMHTW